MNIKLVLIGCVLISLGICKALEPSSDRKSAAEKGFYSIYLESFATVIAAIGVM